MDLCLGGVLSICHILWTQMASGVGARLKGGDVKMYPQTVPLTGKGAYDHVNPGPAM